MNRFILFQWLSVGASFQVAWALSISKPDSAAFPKYTLLLKNIWKSCHLDLSFKVKTIIWISCVFRAAPSQNIRFQCPFQSSQPGGLSVFIIVTKLHGKPLRKLTLNCHGWKRRLTLEGDTMNWEGDWISTRSWPHQNVDLQTNPGRQTKAQ